MESATLPSAAVVRPRYGKTDPHSAAIALGITVPLALLVSALILYLGRWSAEQRAANPMARSDEISLSSEYTSSMADRSAADAKVDSES